MANNNLASIPELWSREGLAILTETTVAAGMVNRQYSAELANFGDTVHAHRAARRTIRRKNDDDEFTASDTSLADVPVKLNQWFYDSFVIKDGEFSKSLVDLRTKHLVPAIHTIARGIDRALLGQVHAFLRQGTNTKRSGKLGGLTKDNADQYLLEAQQALNLNNAPEGVKGVVLGPVALTPMQLNPNFINADKRGDQGQALRTGQIGQVYNSDVRMSQNANYVLAANADTQAVTVNNMGGYAAGYAGSITIDDPGTNPTVGEYFVFDENGQPTYVTATGGGTDVTLNEPLKYAISDGGTAPVGTGKHYLKCTNEATERAAGYEKTMTFTHTASKNLQVGQLLSFGTTSRHTYTIIEVAATTSTTTTVLLDRPLDATVASGANAFPGPAGGMNLVLHQDALALVSRPLAIPGNEFGVMSAVQSYEGLGLRVTMQYDSKAGGMRVNVDMLAGIAVLDENLATVLLS